MTGGLCACGCGRPVRPKKGPQGTAVRYAEKRCAVRVWYRRSLGEPIDDTPDLPPAEIDAIIARARAQQRYARATGGAA